VKRLAFLLPLAFAMVGCGDDGDVVAGRGVITETTNGVAARGRVLGPDDTPLVLGEVRAVRADDTPEAWNGVPRSRDSLDAAGYFEIDRLDAAAWDLVAVARDASGREVLSRVGFTVSQGDSRVLLPDLSATPASRLRGTYAAYDSAVATLPTGWRLRATPRGLGVWMFLDSTGSWAFEGVPSGTYRVRIEKVDGTPGNETVLQEFDALAP
jgi:hypothetical protein